MFDVSFSELFVIAVVALLVVGPEKLPKLARTLGAFVGRSQRYLAQVKEEVNREMRFEELQKLQQEIKQSAQNTETELKNLTTKKPRKSPKVTKPAKSTTKTIKPKIKPVISKRVKPAVESAAKRISNDAN